MKNYETKNEQGKNVIFSAFLLFTALICGAVIMIVEVLGSRVVGPFFGVSLFVWTSLITVTLVALAVGYAAGGNLADKKSSPDNLYVIIVSAGVMLLLVPLLKAPVLKSCLPLGLRAGALASSAVLFGPPLFLLGCVSPYVIRIAAQEIRNIGRTVGLFYAVSTAGSFAGTILTGFVLIARFGVGRIFDASGILLIAISALYFTFFRRRFIFLLLLAPAVLFPALRHGRPTSSVTPDGTVVTLVAEKDGFYGNLKVVDYSFGSTHTRELLIDGLIQGGIDVADGMSIYEYPYHMEFLPYAINPKGKTCLVIGLGAGIIPTWYSNMGIKTDVVDIDPAVLEMAKKHFGFSTSGDTIISDARYYLTSTSKQYDYIILDVFNGDTTPGHLLSVEALKILKQRLNKGGVLAVNLAGSLKKETYMTASAAATIRSVFGYATIYPSFPYEMNEGWGNLSIIAVADGRPPHISAPPALMKVHPMAEENIRKFFGKTFSFSPDTPCMILTDDYNPIDFFDLWLKERIRKNLLDNTNADILI